MSVFAADCGLHGTLGKKHDTPYLVQVMSIPYPEGLIGFLDQQVLAAYRNEPHKYEIMSDNFEGTLTVTDEYYRELEAVVTTNECISIRFGYTISRAQLVHNELI